MLVTTTHIQKLEHLLGLRAPMSSQASPFADDTHLFQYFDKGGEFRSSTEFVAYNNQVLARDRKSGRLRLRTGMYARMAPAYFVFIGLGVSLIIVDISLGFAL